MTLGTDPSVSARDRRKLWALGARLGRAAVSAGR
jgi:hypothetical protein